MSYSSIIASDKTPALQRYDVLIAGGAVAVVEPDDVYEFASTLRASRGARRVFSCPENIEMSNFSLECISAGPDVGWKKPGFDLSRLGYACVAANEAYAERSIV